MEKKYRNIPAIVSLLAALAVSVIAIIKDCSTNTALLLVFISLLVFYIFGLITRFLLLKTETKKEDTDTTDENNIETNDNIENETESDDK